MPRLLKRLVAASVAAALVLLAPGFPAYQAAAQTMGAVAGAASEAGVSGVSAAAALSLPAAALTAPVSPVAPLPAVLGSLSAPSAPAAAPEAAPVAAAFAAAAPVEAAAAAAPVEAAKASVAALKSAAKPAARRGASSESQAAAGRRTFDLAAPPAADALPVLAAASEDAGESGALKPAAPAESGAQAPAEPPAPKDGKPGKTKLPRSLWGLFWGHDILTVFGIEMHMISQPFLVMNTLKKSAAIMGFVRNVHMGSMSLSNLLPVGLLIDKTDYRVIAVGTALIRAALMGAIPLLFLAGHLTFGVLVAIIALNPLFQNTMIVAEGAARYALLGTDEKLNKEAAATFGKWDALAGIAMPLLGSAVVTALIAHFGMGGYALAYGVYAALLLLSIPIYWLTVRDPRDPKELGMKGFLEFLSGTRSFFWALIKGLALSPVTFVRFARGLLSRAREKKAGTPAAPGEKLKWREKLARVLDAHEATQGFSAILRNDTLFTLISVGSIESFLADAMPMVVLPNFIKDVVGVGPAFHVPVIGGLLATAGGIFGLMLAAESIGHFIAASRMEGEKGDRLIEKLGHGRFYKMAALSSLLFWLMWAVPTLVAPHLFWVNLGVVLFVQFAMQIFHGPVGIVMAPVVRNEIPNDKLGRVESAFGMIDMFFSAAGALAAGFMLDWFSISTAMAAIAVAITVSSILEWKVPGWIFPDGRDPAKKIRPDEPVPPAE
jgi:hypothetical protein